jgi:hypothetical protein
MTTTTTTTITPSMRPLLVLVLVLRRCVPWLRREVVAVARRRGSVRDSPVEENVLAARGVRVVVRRWRRKKGGRPAPEPSAVRSAATATAAATASTTSTSTATTTPVAVASVALATTALAPLAVHDNGGLCRPCRVVQSHVCERLWAVVPSVVPSAVVAR